MAFFCFAKKRSNFRALKKEGLCFDLLCFIVTARPGFFDAREMPNQKRTAQRTRRERAHSVFGQWRKNPPATFLVRRLNELHHEFLNFFLREAELIIDEGLSKRFLLRRFVAGTLGLVKDSGRDKVGSRRFAERGLNV